MPATPRHDPQQFYSAAATGAAAAESAHGRIMDRLSLARLATALLALFAAGARWWTVAAVLTLAFVVLVVLHRRARRRHESARRRRIAAYAGLARASRDWQGMPAVRWTPRLGEAQQTLARDLDVTGDVSLHRLLDVTTPALGSARVLEWLLDDPPQVADIEARAASTGALRDDAQTLLAFAAAGVSHRRVLSRGVAQFTEWLSAEAPTRHARLPSALSAVGVAAGLLLLTVVSMEPRLPGVISLMVSVQVAIAIFARRHLHRELGGVGDALGQLEDAVAAMERVSALPAVPGKFGEVQSRLRGEHALPALARLRRLLDWNNIRHTPLAHWSINAAVGLDVYVWRGIRAWRAEHRAHAARWITDIADAEALVALATLGFDNPSWAAATVHEDDAAAPLDARSLGHPLIVPGKVVRNDLLLAERGAVTVVSGSNMAGKTTYLRAAGLNTLLAQAGGPVCAERMLVRRCRVRTSVRIEDDLAGGVSLFMAEAMRLRAIVGESEAGGPVLFLLDEILHGTNAHDRREATRLVLRRLSAAGASGLVTTHDPTIAGAESRQLHFREHIFPEGEAFRMEFDYTVREGPATTANALAVMKMLGLA